MSYTLARDLNEYHPYIGQGEPIMLLKMSGGDGLSQPLYYDAKASANYAACQRDGKAIGLYHFAGGKDPIVEADFFIKACSPLAENDVLALDIERGQAWNLITPDGVAWALTFVTHVHDTTGVWPLVYMNTSTLQSRDWSTVLTNCALWIADYRYSPDQDVPTGRPYLIHQYADTPDDMDAVFCDIETFKKYGWHSSIPVPVPTPAVIEPVPAPPTPEVPPVVIPAPTPVTTPVIVPQGTSTVTLPPAVKPLPPFKSDDWLYRLIKLIIRLLHRA